MLRIGARDGDLILTNGLTSAVVKKESGTLVDFWPHSPREPSVAQLGNETRIDSLWHLQSFVFANRVEHPLVAARTLAKGGAVVCDGKLDLGAGIVGFTTRYTLVPEQAVLLIATQFELLAGGNAIDLKLGDRIKWGNVDYFAEGVGRTPPSFSGTANWIGRHGASGDLRLESRSGPMRLETRMQHHGMAAPIKALYKQLRVTRARPATIERELRLEPLPEQPPRDAVEDDRGTLELRVQNEHGCPLPAKLKFAGRGETPTPDFGSDGDVSGAGRFAWTGNGRASVDLPPGGYRVLVTAGLEREAESLDIDIDTGKTTKHQVTLPRAVHTPGWISADLHLHQSPSVDADISLANRVISIAAEGIEYAVASDHYAATNLAPTVQHLRETGILTAPIITSVGTEVSTVGNVFGHFNVFPLEPSAQIPYVDQTPASLFDSMRRASKEGIIQVNHPRQPRIGYFHRYRMDPATGRIPFEHRNTYVSDFDALEVFNGLDAPRPAMVTRVIEDWLHLLGRGHRYTATGNSDSHKLFFVDPGMPRNYIHFGNTTLDATDTCATERSIVEAIRQGRVVVTTGPMIHADILGKGPGETVAGLGKTVPLRIVVQAPAWVDVDWVEVRLGSSGRLVRWLPVTKSRGGVRLDATVSVRFAKPTFVIVHAGGRTPLPHLFFSNVKPFAFTNPIWLEP